MSKRYGGRQPMERPQERLTARANEILTSAPLKQAALQMESGWEPERGPRPSRWFWHECPDLRELDDNMPDLRGVAWGRVRVVGLAPAKGSEGRASWVIRCACGLFETRSAKAIRQQTNPDECCQRCEYLQRLRRHEFFNRHGRWPSDCGEAA